MATTACKKSTGCSLRVMLVDQGEGFPDIEVKGCNYIAQLTDTPKLEEGLERNSAFSCNRKQLLNPLSAVSCIFSSHQGHRGEQSLYLETFSPFHTLAVREREEHRT